MKPSWDNAPEWANWLGQENSGSWWWFAEKPKADMMYYHWYNRYPRRKELAALSKGNTCAPGWQHTLERRPKEKVA